MHIKTKEEEPIRSHRSHSKRRFLVSIFITTIALAGLATWAISGAISSTNAIADISVDSNKGYKSDNKYRLFYGANPSANGQMWATEWYKVTTSGATHDAVCIEPSKSSATSAAATIDEITNATIKRILLVTVESFSKSGSGSPKKFYTEFKNSHNWDTISNQIHCIRENNCSRIGGPNSTYTKYFNAGHPTEDEYIYILGHAMAGKTYTGAYYGLFDGSDVTTLENLIKEINNWFDNEGYNQYLSDFHLFTAKGASNQQTVAWLEYEKPQARIKIKKVDAETKGVENTINGTTYTVKGTEFTLTYPDGTTAILTIDKNGVATSDWLDIGTYTIKETTATTGYKKNSAKIKFKIRRQDAGNTIDISKLNGVKPNPCANGDSFNSSSSQGCQFENSLDKKAYVKIRKAINTGNPQDTDKISYKGLKVKGTLFNVFKQDNLNDVITTITIGSDGTGTTKKALEPGTYVIKEDAPPEGFNPNTTNLTFTITADNVDVVPPTLDYTTSSDPCTTKKTPSPCTFYNTPIEGTIKLTKLGYELSESGEATTRILSDISFQAIRQVNGQDTSVKYTIGPTTTDGEIISEPMVYGTYRAVEKSNNHNKAYKPLEFTFSITQNGDNSSTITIVDGTGSVSGGNTLIDEVPDNPSLHTVARNSTSTAQSPSKDIEISGSAGVTDKITCKGLTAGAKYQLVGTLWDKAANTRAKRTSGSSNYVEQTTTFTADADGKCNGSTGIDMEFPTFDSSLYMGKTLAIKVVLYKNNGTSSDWVRLFIHNINLTDSNEEVVVQNLRMETLARSDRSDKKKLTAGKVDIIDEVTIYGLIKNRQYALVGYVKHGNTVVATKESSCFTMNKSTGTKYQDSMTFSDFDSTPYVGESLTIVQELYQCVSNNRSGSPLITHAATDGSQTVTVLTPTLGTSAVNANNPPKREIEIGSVDASSGSPTIKDTITYKNLAIDTVYTIHGEVWKLDGNNATTRVATSEKSFTASTENGSDWELTFPVDTATHCSVDGNVTLPCKFVVYEYICYGSNASNCNTNTAFAKHESPTDNKQIISVVPAVISTKAKTERSDNKKLAIGHNVKIIDEYYITGLIHNENYTLKGYVMHGNAVVTEATYDFTMTQSTGTKLQGEIAFDVNSIPYEGKDLTVVQKLYLQGGTDPIATHTAEDDSQTVTVLNSNIGTSAVNDRNPSKQVLEVGHTVDANNSPTIRDTVTYNGLDVNTPYTVVGEVWKLDSNGSAATLVYTSEPQPLNHTAENGQKTMTFPVDTIASCKNNSNKLVLPCKFVVFESIRYGNNTLNHRDASDQNQIVSVGTPTVSTAATDSQNSSKALSVGTTTVIDKVTYENLMPGHTYTLEGKLIDLETGSVVKNSANQEVTATETIHPASNGTETVTVDSFKTFDTTLQYDHSKDGNQKNYVVYQTLKSQDGVELYVHAENADNNQIVKIGVPEITTSATYKVDGTHSLGVGNITMVDKIHYKGLVENEWYTVVGTLIDPTTNQPVTINGTVVSSTKEFQADAKGIGDIEQEFNFNTTTVQGKKFVVYERLYRNSAHHGDDRLLALHEPAVDADNQTVTVRKVSIGTTASDKADNNNVIEPKSEQIIKDTVHYENLLANTQYTLYGYLYDKTNHQVLKDTSGELITAKKTFTTTNVSGDVVVEFEINAYDLPGVEIVVFEYLFPGNATTTKPDGTVDETDEHVIAYHANENDPSQTIKVAMRVGTTVVDSYDGNQTVGVGTNVKIVDNVKYEGAVVGKTYKAVGWLVYKTAGKTPHGAHEAGDTFYSPVITCTENPASDEDSEGEEGGESESTDGEEAEGKDDSSSYPCERDWEIVLGEKTFTVGEAGYEETTGFVPVELEFDSREIIGEQLVVFEELYEVGGPDEPVAEHKELDDPAQTITVDTPAIHTIAVDKADGDKELADNADVIILDKVEYTGLVAGSTYTLHGILVDKSSGERISGGLTEVSWTFTPDRDAGTEEIEFTLNTTGMSGKEIVAFETLYIDEYVAEDNKIAEHKDLNDDSQTVWVKIKNPDTGLLTHSLDEVKKTNLYITIGGIAALVAGGWVATRLIKRRKIHSF